MENRTLFCKKINEPSTVTVTLSPCLSRLTQLQPGYCALVGTDTSGPEWVSVCELRRRRRRCARTGADAQPECSARIAMEGAVGIGGVLPPTLGLTKRKVPSEQRVHCDGFKLRAGCVPAPLRTDAIYHTSQLVGNLISRAGAGRNRYLGES
jgi:hypothetical protein